MKQEIKKIFLFLVLSCVVVFVFEVMIALTMFLFYGFLETTMTAFMLDQDTRFFLFSVYCGFGFAGLFICNITLIVTIANNYEKIKNKILEWINERV